MKRNKWKLKLAFTIVLFILINIVIEGTCLSNEINSNVLRRVFAIKSGNSTGTAFTLDYDGKQYLVTARHVLSDTSSIQMISILNDTNWIDV